jgi:hypothetical protein
VTDLDREVRGLLRERAGREEAPRELPAAVRRRVRARQSGVVGGVAALILAIALPIVAAPGWFQRDEEERQEQSTTPVTSTVYGVSITYPDDWTLLQLNARHDMSGVDPSSLFQLSNFDPLGGSRRWVCPLPGGSIPEGGVVLFVQELLNWDRPVPLWPVELSSGSATFDTCGQTMARWEVDGRTFEAGVVGDLDGAAYRDVVTAFRSMAFEPPDDDPPLGTATTTVDHAYVVTSSHEASHPWNLLAFRYGIDNDNELCVGLDPIGPPEYRCWINPNDNDWMDFALDVAMVGGSPFAFGWAPSETRRLETPEGRPLGLAVLPDGLRVGASAFVGPADELVADGMRLAEVRILDIDGNVVDRRQWIQPTDLGEPSIIAFDHAFGTLWWIWDDGERVSLKSEAGVIQTISQRVLPAGEHLRVWSHTFTRETPNGTGYETVVFGISSREASQVTVILSDGTAKDASVHTLEYEIEGPDLIDLSHFFVVTVPGATRGEIVLVDTGCVVLDRVPLVPDTPPPTSPYPLPDPGCIGP